MEKNPFNELIYQIKDISKSNITENRQLNIGDVISPLPDLQIKTSGIILDRDNLLIDKWLLDRHNEAVTYTQGEHTHESEDGSHSHTGGGHSHSLLSYVDELRIGDKVVMLREGDMFYILSKVVKF